MNNVYVFNSIITIDHQTQKNYILSSSNTEINFPYFQIESPRYLHNEIKCKVKNFFKTNTIRFIEEIIISFLDIQNEHLIQYAEKTISPTNDDIILLCSIILSDKLNTNLYWQNFNYQINLKNEDLVTTIIDYCLQKSLT